jgi:hypothetical protein
MKWKITIAVFVLVAVALVCYRLGYRAAVRNEIAIEARNNCISNLRLLDGCKQQWALENKKSPNDVPTWADLKLYLRHSIIICQSGGTYTLDRVEAAPFCSVPGHQLP